MRLILADLLRPLGAILVVLSVPACGSPKRDAEILCDVHAACGIARTAAGPDKQLAITKCLDGKITSKEGKKWLGALSLPLDPEARAKLLGEFAKSQGLDRCPDATPAKSSP
jgi:hypothetical protein